MYRVAGTCYFVDLPGYGYARASKRARAGFQRLLAAYVADRGPLAGVIWLLDLRRDPSAEDLAMAALLVRRGVPVLVALTKADKVPRGGRGARARAIADAVGVPEDQCVLTSARRNEGIGSLRDATLTLAGSAARGPRGGE